MDAYAALQSTPVFYLTPRKDLLLGIEYLIETEKFKLDYILVETNGLMDPSNVIPNSCN